MSIRVIAVTSVLLLSAAARATVMEPLDTETMVRRANQGIVLGTVEGSVSRWTADHNRIYTEVTVRIDRAYKGAFKAGDKVVVQREGGSVDGIGMRVYGAASFQPGEQALLFLERRAQATFVVGMAQGKLTVSRTPDGALMVAPNLSGIAFTRPAASPAAAGLRRLEEVEHEILKLVPKTEKPPQ